jgi:hypothetical protein
LKTRIATFKPTAVLLSFFVFLLAKSGQAQIFEGFESSDGAFFGVEGDGSISIQTTGGNPGKCLREDDSTLGLGSYVLLSPSFLGKWEVDGQDSLFFDYKTVNISGGSTQGGPFHVELFGPGGVARFSPNFVLPSFNTWHKKQIPIDSSKWVTLSGTWTGLLQEIDRIRIYTEFVVGDEYSLIDNVCSTFTPIPLFNSSGLCSVFPANAGFDGWSFANAATPASINTDGNPPNCIRLSEAGNTAQMIAPPKFKGNWASLNGSYVLNIDLKIVGTQPTITLPSYFIRIVGRQGAAQVNLTPALVDSARGKWFRYSFPLQSGVWEQVFGTWESTLVQVTNLLIQPEFLSGSGTETILVDNVCIRQLTGSEPLLNDLADFQPFPNPAQTEVLFPQSSSIRLVSVLGKTVLSIPGPADQIPLHSIEPGIYLLSGIRQKPGPNGCRFANRPCLQGILPDNS